jgi:hypothetical protein
MRLGEGRWVKHDGVILASPGILIAEHLEGVPLNPTNLCTQRSHIQAEISFCYFQCSATRVDPSDFRTNLRKVERKPTLIGTYVECPTPGVSRSDSVIQTLIQESTRLLPGSRVVMKLEPIEPEYNLQTRSERWGVERVCWRTLELLGDLNLSIRAFYDSDIWKMFCQNARDDIPNPVLGGALREELHDNQATITICDDSRKPIGFGEDQPTSVGVLIHAAEAAPQSNCRSYALVDQSEIALFSQTNFTA